MKLFPLACFLFFSCYSLPVKAINYYFSSSGGNDSYTLTQVTKKETPWKSLDKLNSLFPSLKPGDSVLLKCGDIFYGMITINSSGSKERPIVIASYGAGEKPVITGFKTIDNWIPLKNGIWESNSPVTALNSLHVVVINDQIQQIGRYPNTDSPNKGYLIIAAHQGKNLLTGTGESNNQDWTGGDIVVRSSQYTIDRAKIISQSGNTFTFSQGMTYEPKEGYGYFIQNHPGTLDKKGEWYFDQNTKKIKIFYGGEKPGKVQVSSIDNLVKIYAQSNIFINDIAFEGANENAIEIKGNGSKNAIQKCEVKYSGIDGIYAGDQDGLLIKDCEIANSLNHGINVSNNSTVLNCIVRNSGVIAGMTQNNAGIAAISNSGDGSSTLNNIVKNTGYIGIKFGRNNSLVKNNVVDSFCLIKQDGGGIYAQGKKTEKYSGTKIIGNIVMNSPGAPEGTTTKNNNSIGVYCDDFLSNLEVTGNSIFNCGVGLYLHNTQNVIVQNNLCFNNERVQFQISRDKTDYPVEGLVVKHNTFFSYKPKQVVAYFTSRENDFETFGDIDENLYTRPFNESGNVFQKKVGRLMAANYSLAENLKAYPRMDKKSGNLKIKLSKEDQIKFYFNPDKNDKTIKLDGKFYDTSGKLHKNVINILPYTSIILIKAE